MQLQKTTGRSDVRARMDLQYNRSMCHSIPCSTARLGGPERPNLAPIIAILTCLPSIQNHRNRSAGFRGRSSAECSRACRPCLGWCGNVARVNWPGARKAGRASINSMFVDYQEIGKERREIGGHSVWGFGGWTITVPGYHMFAVQVLCVLTL